jgi:3-phenylpropionate/trans-cinnamate dioxygenase ferredoxin reductase subunit
MPATEALRGLPNAASERVLILGAGHAGFTAAATLRSGGYKGSIRLIGDEAEPPYERPPLTKDYLLGKRARPSLSFRNADFFAANTIEYVANVRALRICRDSRTVDFSDGAVTGFDKLNLATGARNRTLTLTEPGTPGIFGIRNLADADAIIAALGTASEIGVIGAGFIGLEFTAAARRLGKSVTVIEAQPRLLQRAVPEPVSEFLRQVHERNGVRFLLSDSVSAVTPKSERHIELRTATARLDVQCVIVGIGVLPNDDLARDAGLTVDDGIVVDETMRTADPDILAIGDCARMRTARGGSVRIESVQNAVDQARQAAKTILGGEESYSAIPWFWSDQYDVKLQIAGLPGPTRTLAIKGEPAVGSFSIASFTGDRLICVHSINAAGDHVRARRLLSDSNPMTRGSMAILGYRAL